MAGYIKSIGSLSQLAAQVVEPDQLSAAVQSFSLSPVAGYAAVDVDEVQLIGQYR